ncbi:TPA: hypothetical protein EYP66_09335 [Candidatus Poribacteria bacterium]|nr:hypothetical protein [Candidatus Poribacteria bacterium]
MRKRFTTTAVPISVSDIIAGIKAILRHQYCIEKFELGFAKYINARRAFLVNSGTTAFYIILKALMRLSDKTEVVIPAYTAPAVTLAIWKAGLKPVLCDVSLDTFNMDIISLTNIASDDILCVASTHLFGLPCDVLSVNEFVKEKNIFVIEDAAQAMGAKLNDKMAGTIGDVGFFSLAKGKNLSTYTGGIIVTNRSDLAPLLKEEIQKLEEPSGIYKALNPFLLSALALMVRPMVYGMFHRLASFFKSTEVYYSFDAMKYTEFQAAVGLSLLKRLPGFIQARQANGSLLYKSLAEIHGIRLPVVIEKGVPAYNHFPVLLEESGHIAQVQQELWRLGIDTSRMYLRPVHHCYQLGYAKSPEPFPNAAYIAERLLTLPTHPFIDSSIIQNIIRKVIHATSG